jgi:hypothetical protein
VAQSVLKCEHRIPSNKNVSHSEVVRATWSSTVERANLTRVGLYVGAMVAAALIGWMAGPVAAVAESFGVITNRATSCLRKI